MPTPHHGPTAPARRPGVLVAARTPLTRIGLAADLERAGFAVFTAAGGADALAEYAAHRREVDVLLVEADLPDLPAPAFYARWAAHVPRLPCCFFAGAGGSRLAEQAAEMGATVVVWPLRFAELAETLFAATAGLL